MRIDSLHSDRKARQMKPGNNMVAIPEYFPKGSYVISFLDVHVNIRDETTTNTGYHTQVIPQEYMAIDVVRDQVMSAMTSNDAPMLF